MAYRGRDGWHTDTNSVVSNGPDMLPTKAPQHPIPTMQGAFEESMMETLQEADNYTKDLSKMDSVDRRRMLLEQSTYERTVAGRWKQKSGENFHPLWKLVAQISFGMHLLHQGLAKSDEEVIKILQTHVDEIDGFLERTTEDLELAQRDIEERIRYLKLPLEHGDVFDNMLGDRKFRNAILEGNDKIEHIVDRTGVALRDTLKDVKKGYDGTKELFRYFKKLDSSWENQTEEHMGVYAAMMGNTEGWTGAYAELQRKGNALHESLVELSTIIAEIQRRVGIASRKNLPSAPTSRVTTQPPSRATSVYHTQSTPQSPTKPHITSAIGTGMRNRDPSQRVPNDRWAQTYAADRYRNKHGQSANVGIGESASSSHQRRESDDSTSKRVSFSERSSKRKSGDSWKRESGSNSNRRSKERSGLEGLKTSWFRKSSAESSTSSLKDKRKSASNPSLASPTIQTPYDIETGMRTTRNAVSKPVSRENSITSASNTMSPIRMSESIVGQSPAPLSRRPPRESMPEDAIEEVTEDEMESEDEPEAEIIQASQVAQKPAENGEVAKKIKIASPIAVVSPKRFTLRDLPLRNYKSTDSLPEGKTAEEKARRSSQPNMAAAIASLRRSSTFNGTDSSPRNSARRTSDGKPEPLRVSRVSSFAPFGRTPTGTASQHSSESIPTRLPTTPKTHKRPANLKLFPTIAAGRAMSPGPQTAPLDRTTPLFSATGIASPTSAERAQQYEKLPKMPQTPAERGRSPPPPERVPTPPQERGNISPSLRALTSATVSGPEPDYPFGFGEDEGDDGEKGEPFIAELSARPPTADGERDSSTERTAELGAESPVIKQSKSSPFIDPEEKKEEAAARQREREMRMEAEKRKVQEQIMSKVVQKSSSIDLDRPRREAAYPTGDIKQLHAPPIISPPPNQSLYPKHSPLNINQSSAADFGTASYDLPFSKHNPTPIKDRRSPWRRLLRFLRPASRAASVDGRMDDAQSIGSMERTPSTDKRSGRRVFGGLSLAFGRLAHRRNRSKDLRINTDGGLQPFGAWGQVERGMSWSDTRRGSDAGASPPKLGGANGHMGGGGGDDHDMPYAGSSPSANAALAEHIGQPAVTPRPEQGTMSIPGVGTIDFSRASTYVRLAEEKQAQLQSLLQQQQDREDAELQRKKEEAELAVLVSQRKEAVAMLEKQRAESEASRAADGAAVAERRGFAAAPVEDITEEEADERADRGTTPRVDEPAQSPVAAMPAADDERNSAQYLDQHSGQRSGQHSAPHSTQPSPRAPSEASASPSSRSNRESSLLARKSDATPNTGLSLMLSPSLTSEIFSGHGDGAGSGVNGHARKDSAEAQSHLGHSRKTSSEAAGASPINLQPPTEGKAAQILGTATAETKVHHGSGGLNSAGGGSVGRGMALGARSPALGADVNPIDVKMNSAKERERREKAESMGSAAGAASPSSPASPASKKEGMGESLRQSSASDGEGGMEDGVQDVVPVVAGEGGGWAEGKKVPEFLYQDPMKDGPVRDPVRERNGTPF